MTPPDLPARLRPEIEALETSGISQLFALGVDREGVIPLWFGEGDITTPFGGYKQSGFGGRDNSLHAHDQYTELKTIWIDLGDRNAQDPID